MPDSWLTCHACDREFDASDDEPHPRSNDDITGQMTLFCPCGAMFVECLPCGNFVQPDAGDESTRVAGYATHKACVSGADDDTIENLEELGVTPVPDEFIEALKEEIR